MTLRPLRRKDVSGPDQEVACGVYDGAARIEAQQPIGTGHQDNTGAGRARWLVETYGRHPDGEIRIDRHRLGVGGASVGLQTGNARAKMNADVLNSFAGHTDMLNDRQSHWSNATAESAQGVVVHGHWDVTNTSDRDVVIL
jgi:hypothetical protein